MASAQNGYVLSDRATWLNFRNKGDLDIVVEGDRRLFNQYGVILVNPAKHPHVKRVDGQAFIDWLVSPKGRRPSPITRSAGNRCSSPTQPSRERKSFLGFRIFACAVLRFFTRTGFHFA